MRTGRIAPADRAALRTFLRRWAGEHLEAAVEATTGWRVVGRLDGRGAHEQLAALELSPAAQRQITVALAVIGHVNSQLAPLDRTSRGFARAKPGCRALMRHHGIGPQVACAILAELGDARRFSSSRRSVRFAGLDVTVHESDTKPRAGPSRQGPPVLRWAAFEAAESATNPASPDHAYYLRSSSACEPTGQCCRSRASCCATRTTRCANSATTRSRRPPEPRLSPAGERLARRQR